MTSVQIRRMTCAALFLALAMVLPFVTGQIPEIGQSLCPMHIPVLLCGFMCGWPWGLAVGLIAPVLRSAVFGMPPMFPEAVAMTFELAVYGAVSGLMYRLLCRRKRGICITLLTAMIAGRVVWGIARWILAGLSGTEFTWQFFLAGAVTTAIPGIVMHLVLIPVLVMGMERAGLSLNRPRGAAGT